MRRPGLSLTILILSLNLTFKLYAQEVSIANLSSAKGFFGDKIEISGSGFSTTAANMEVWFGAAKGTVVESRENILIATVPSGATTSTVTVLNKTNNLSASSSQIFFPVFNGDPAADLSITDPYTFTNTNEVFDLQMADLDNDGNNDIVSTKRDAASTTIQIYRNTTNGSNISFAESTVSIGVPSLKVAIGDIDNDGKLDLVVTQENDFTLFVLRNTSTVGSITFAAAKSYFLRTSQKINGVCVRDLDLDGKPEVIVSNTQDNEVSIFKNSSTPGVINLSFTPTRIATGGTKAYDLIAEDLNNDGKAEIIVVQSETDIYILPNRSSTGSLEFGSAIVVPANLNLTSIEAGDINDDGLADLVGSDVLDQRFALLINQSSGDQINFGPASITDISFRCFGVALADYTGNGQLDIIAASAGGSELVIIKNESENGSLSLTPDVIPQPSGSFYIVKIGRAHV